MKRNRFNKAWVHRHVTDPFVRQAGQDGYRSRAAYKLTEIDDRDHLILPGMAVVDLGAAPGSWSQIARQRVGASGRVVAIDVVAMAPVAGVEILQADFSTDAGLQALLGALGDDCAGLVLSDMAPNLSGIGTVDQARVMHLADLALDFSCRYLRSEGALLVKVFQGADFDAFRARMGAVFGKVAVRKPKASRGESAEVYLLGKEKKSTSLSVR